MSYRRTMLGQGVLGSLVQMNSKFNDLINVQGLPHKNYDGDLYNEHLNRDFKVNLNQSYKRKLTYKNNLRKHQINSRMLRMF